MLSSKRLLSRATKRVKRRAQSMGIRFRLAVKQADAEASKDWFWISMAALLSFACLLWCLFKALRVAVWMLGTSSASHVLGPSSARAWRSSIQDNPIYQAVDSHPLVGDRSWRYAVIRQEVDDMFPPEAERSLQVVQELQQARPSYSVAPIPEQAYDIYDCPPTPPPGYPYEWWLVQDVLSNWNPDNTTVPDRIFQGLCVFDYQTDHETAMTYRDAEVPFVVVNDPRVAATTERWNQPGYLENLLGDVPHRTVISESNKILYAAPFPKDTQRRLRRGERFRQPPPGWHNPTENTRMPYKEWLKKANVSDQALTAPEARHYYYRLIGCGMPHADGSCDRDSSEYLFDELPFFQPNEGDIYLRDVDQQRGIHCRFGMKGIVAENHFDLNRNSIVVLSGSRRYLLAHPNQCPNMCLYDQHHPSARHSQVDWSNPNMEQFPDFYEALGNEVVLQAGDVLYLPNLWFHHIVSLELNVQCNTRSGHGPEYMEEIRQCGFPNIH